VLQNASPTLQGQKESLLTVLLTSQLLKASHQARTLLHASASRR
jgi:hypothetical protein